MRSVMQGMWSLIVAVGNVIVIIVAEVKGIERQVSILFFMRNILYRSTVSINFSGYRVFRICRHNGSSCFSVHVACS